MKAIVISEAAFELARKQLISQLTKAVEKREDKIKSGNVVGMAAEPENEVNYYVTQVFQTMADS